MKIWHQSDFNFQIILIYYLSTFKQLLIKEYTFEMINNSNRDGYGH